MNYPTELHQLAIRNMEIIETAPTVVDETEKMLFSAINAHIKNRIEAKKDWDGCYDLITNEDDEETTFTPNNWPKSAEGSFYAYYTLDEMEDSKVEHYLSSAVGLRGESLGLYFGVNISALTLNVKEYKPKLNKFFNDNVALQKAGFTLTPNKKSLVRRFHFDTEKLAEAYPDVEDIFAPLDEALNDLFKVHEEFNTFVQSLPWTNEA